MRINGGAETTTSQDVNLEIQVQDDQTPQHLLRMRFSNDGVYWSAWEPYAPNRTWQLSGDVLSVVDFGDGLFRRF